MKTALQGRRQGHAPSFHELVGDARRDAGKSDGYQSAGTPLSRRRDRVTIPVNRSCAGLAGLF